MVGTVAITTWGSVSAAAGRAQRKTNGNDGRNSREAGEKTIHRAQWNLPSDWRHPLTPPVLAGGDPC